MQASGPLIKSVNKPIFKGQFFGVIGKIDREDFSILGLQIEYMELDERPKGN